MAIGYRSSASDGGTATNVALTKPTGTAAGDVLVACFTVITTNAITPPAGWSTADSWTPLDFMRQAIFYRVCGDSEPASYTFSWGASAAYVCGVSAYTGVDNTTPSDATASENADWSGTSLVGLSITTATDGAWLIWTMGSNTGGMSVTPPTGFDERWEEPWARTGEQCDDEQASAGASGNKTGSTSSSTWAVTMWALKPAGGGGSVAQVAGVAWASVGQIAGVAEASIAQIVGVTAN